MPGARTNPIKLGPQPDNDRYQIMTTTRRTAESLRHLAHNSSDKRFRQDKSAQKVASGLLASAKIIAREHGFRRSMVSFLHLREWTGHDLFVVLSDDNCRRMPPERAVQVYASGVKVFHVSWRVGSTNMTVHQFKRGDWESALRFAAGCMSPDQFREPS